MLYNKSSISFVVLFSYLVLSTITSIAMSAGKLRQNCMYISVGIFPSLLLSVLITFFSSLDLPFFNWQSIKHLKLRG